MSDSALLLDTSDSVPFAEQQSRFAVHVASPEEDGSVAVLGVFAF